MHMESALQTLRLQGWIPMASALGTDMRPPLWVTNEFKGHGGHIDRAYLTTTPADPKGRFVALIAVAKALACSQEMCTWHLAQGY